MEKTIDFKAVAAEVVESIRDLNSKREAMNTLFPDKQSMYAGIFRYKGAKEFMDALDALTLKFQGASIEMDDQGWHIMRGVTAESNFQTMGVGALITGVSNLFVFIAFDEYGNSWMSDEPIEGKYLALKLANLAGYAETLSEEEQGLLFLEMQQNPEAKKEALRTIALGLENAIKGGCTVKVCGEVVYTGDQVVDVLIKHGVTTENVAEVVTVEKIEEVLQ